LPCTWKWLRRRACHRRQAHRAERSTPGRRGRTWSRRKRFHRRSTPGPRLIWIPIHRCSTPSRHSMWIPIRRCSTPNRHSMWIPIRRSIPARPRRRRASFPSPGSGTRGRRRAESETRIQAPEPRRSSPRTRAYLLPGEALRPASDTSADVRARHAWSGGASAAPQSGSLIAPRGSSRTAKSRRPADPSAFAMGGSVLEGADPRSGLARTAH
jgi:hypothetical protein